MEWYFIVLIVLGGVAFAVGLYLIFAAVVAKKCLQAATTPIAHTLEEARVFQAEYEDMDFDDYDNVWRKQPFETEGKQGKIRGEVIFNNGEANRAKVAIICHGHTWNRVNSVKYARIFLDRGYNVVIYDHAYFGLSDGKFTTLSAQ